MRQENTALILLVDEARESENLFRHAQAAVAAGAQSLLLLACDRNGLTPALVDAGLQALSVPVFGGVFPQIVIDSRRLEQGYVVCGLPFAVTVEYVAKLSEPSADYRSALAALTATVNPPQTLVVLVDGLSTRISALLESLYGEFGDECTYIGGGAGSLSFQQQPCLFSNHGLVGDCAQLTALDLPVSIGIEHGWHSFAGPFFVTGSQHNTLLSLDYQPAFEVYRRVVEADSGRSFADTPFFELSKAYPFGLVRLTKDVVVRDPLSLNGNAITCIGEVPAHHMLYILKGDAEHLLLAARDCTLTALRAQPAPCMALLFDCVSRALFLDSRFQEELDTIRAHLPADLPLLGVLSLGEIADAGNACLEFFNKTTVLGIVADA
ncbi:MAG: FIST N-terminal domain-containing protein [Candidatus Thiothrix putei]|uniref:FIST N-terminal domain-containing protein n=1 Tax=Candidatus Thiothrix putei TaxID=3080811 RepID=A0AA95HEB4_9GAMM|nr:MAG: FIST N-terminal domain-containing protein [Candidatus Thiothrix putei]